MKTFKFIVLAITFLLLTSSIVMAAVNNNDIQYAKQYLIILIHGIGDDHACFDKVKYYLDKTLGLEGYVYMYQFSDPFLNIEKEGWEFGDRAYDNPEAVNKDSDIIDPTGGNPQLRQPWEITKRENNGKGGSGKCWLEQAKEDFIVWFKDPKKNINNPTGRAPVDSTGPDNEVPHKFIIIAHSMGGLAVRSYIYGNDHAGNRFYNNDIEKVVYIDTPHLGSSAAKASIWAQNNQVVMRYAAPMFMIALGTGNPFFTKANPQMGKLLASNGAYALGGSLLFDLSLSNINRFNKLPAMNDLCPNSSILNSINSAALGDYTPINQHIIVGRGAPTPQLINDFEADISTLVVPERIAAALMNATFNDELETWEEKMMSINLTVMSGYPFTEDGDLVITRRSQKGEGIGNLSNAKIHEYLMRSSSIALFDTVSDSVFIASFFMPWPADFVFAVASLTFTGMTVATQDDAKEYVHVHTIMKDKIVINEGLLDNALFDRPAPGSNGLNSVHTMGFDMLTNISTTESSPSTPIATSSFHPVEVKGFTEAGAGRSGFPIVIGGQEKNIEAFTVKEAPTRIEGVLRDFMPLKMQYFQYSENFAAWKDIPILDEYGRFSIDGLRLAEGQNVIAFRAKNKVGYTSNQILNITVNTIPLLPSGFTPAPNSFTNNSQPEFVVNFAKSSYSASSLESVNLTKAILRNETTGTETDITSDVQATQSGGTYDKRLKVTYKPAVPLNDGKYSILVAVSSNVGISQALWDVTIDTTAPTVNIEPLKPFSPKAASTGNLVIKYSASDEASDCLGATRCDLYNLSGNLITEIATDENITGGEHYFNWTGEVPDGDYIVKIKSFDLAGNFSIAKTALTIDSTPPEIIEAKIMPKVMTSKYKEMKLETNISEKSQVFIKMIRPYTKTTKGYLTSATGTPINGQTGIPANYTWSYTNSFLPGPEDGLYNIELTARDEAGNESAPTTIEAVRIDRTPPKIFGQTTLPYVLSNSGKKPYTTKLIYRISEDDDAPENRTKSQ